MRLGPRLGEEPKTWLSVVAGVRRPSSAVFRRRRRQSSVLDRRPAVVGSRRYLSAVGRRSSPIVSGWLVASRREGSSFVVTRRRPSSVLRPPQSSVIADCSSAIGSRRSSVVVCRSLIFVTRRRSLSSVVSCRRSCSLVVVCRRSLVACPSSLFGCRRSSVVVVGPSVIGRAEGIYANLKQGEERLRALASLVCFVCFLHNDYETFTQVQSSKSKLAPETWREFQDLVGCMWEGGQPWVLYGTLGRKGEARQRGRQPAAPAERRQPTCDDRQATCDERATGDARGPATTSDDRRQPSTTRDGEW